MVSGCLEAFVVAFTGSRHGLSVERAIREPRTPRPLTRGPGGDALLTRSTTLRSVKTLPLGMLAAMVIVAAGCDDSTGLDVNPVLVSDTLTIAAPIPQNLGRPSAVDLSGDGGFGIMGPRFPEQVADALRWDLTLRLRDGTLFLMPPGAIGDASSRAAITPAIAGQTFEGLREIPGQSTFRTDTAIALQVGPVYAARTRVLNSFGCIQFSKIRALALDPVAATAHLEVVTNEQCSDPRLVAVD